MIDAHDDLVMIWNMVKVMMMMFLLSYVPFEYRIRWWLERSTLSLVCTFFYFYESPKTFYGKWSRPQRKCQDLKRSWHLEKDPRCFLWHLPNYRLHMPLTCAALNKMVRESAGGENLAWKNSSKNGDGNWNSWNLRPWGEEYHPNRPQDFIQKVTLAWEPH